ncbi:MAG: twin-arginine translocase TatA/TatE family subunit [Sulfuricurvum sp.]
MAMPSGSELLLIFGVVVLLFGSKKIPELAKGLGQGIRSFKNEMKEETHPPAPPAESIPHETQSAAATQTTNTAHPTSTHA